MKKKSPTKAKSGHRPSRPAGTSKSKAQLEGREAERALHGFIAKYTPAVQSLARTALRKMRKLCPGAIEMVYDNYNFLAIGFGPTDRPSEAIFSLALAPRWIILCFLQARNRLPDPRKLLQGSGSVVRHIRILNAERLDDPAIVALMTHANRIARVPLAPRSKRRIIIKSVSAKQRPRRPAE